MPRGKNKAGPRPYVEPPAVPSEVWINKPLNAHENTH